MKLYEITENMKGLQALVDTEELTPEMVRDTVEALDAEFDEKAVGILKVRQQLLGEISQIEKEIERLTLLKKTPENNVNQLSAYLKTNMLTLEKDKLDLGVFKVTLKKASVKLGQIDESKIPAVYWQIIPENKKLDKRLLLKDAKADEMEGVELVESERALIIK